jgi:hypothetical protein
MTLRTEAVTARNVGQAVASLIEGAAAMVVNLDPKLEAMLKEQATRQGISPEELAVKLLRERLILVVRLEPRDEWERGLLEAARPWGVVLSDAALSSEGLYD